jgi:hypothetical protein
MSRRGRGVHVQSEVRRDPRREAELEVQRARREAELDADGLVVAPSAAYLSRVARPAPVQAREPEALVDVARVLRTNRPSAGRRDG